MEQRTEEWFDSRRGKFTASEIYKLCKPKGLGDGGMTYIRAKVAEHFGSFKKEAKSSSLQWGVDNEPIAKEYFQENYFESIEEVGFIELNDNCGASPDGILDSKEIGIEIKCPESPENHIKHCLFESQEDLKKQCEEYYWQIQMCMLVTGFKQWKFISFDPRCLGDEKMFVLDVYADEKDQQLLNDRIVEAVTIKKQMIDKIKKTK